jgi:hypothetical protein
VVALYPYVWFLWSSCVSRRCHCATVPLCPAEGPVVFRGLVLSGFFGVVAGGDFRGDFNGITGSPCCCR